MNLNGVDVPDGNRKAGKCATCGRRVARGFGVQERVNGFPVVQCRACYNAGARLVPAFNLVQGV